MDANIVVQARRFERAQVALNTLRHSLLAAPCVVGAEHMDGVTDHLDALQRKIDAVLADLDAVYLAAESAT